MSKAPSSPSPQRCAHQVVGFAGLAKNAGKTTALQAWLHSRATFRAGLVSIGVDGEETDAVGGHAKPRMWVPEGGLAVTAERAPRSEEGAWDVVEALGCRSVLGELLLLRARRRSALVLAGVRHAGDLRHAIEALLRSGAQRVLVDGALHRRIVADPDQVCGVVLCTGHVVGTSIEAVVSQTREALLRWRLPHPQSLPAVEVATLLAPLTFASPSDGSPWRLDLQGALTPQGVARILALENPPTEIALRHGGHDHLDASTRARMAAHGIGLAARKQPPLLAVAVNPMHPDGRRLDSERLCDALRASIPDVPIYDPCLHPTP